MSGRGGSGSTWGHVGSARARSTSSRVEVDVGTPFKTSCRRSLPIGEVLSGFEFFTKPDQPGLSSSIRLEVVMEQS